MRVPTAIVWRAENRYQKARGKELKALFDDLVSGSLKSVEHTDGTVRTNKETVIETVRGNFVQVFKSTIDSTAINEPPPYKEAVRSWKGGIRNGQLGDKMSGAREMMSGACKIMSGACQI